MARITKALASELARRKWISALIRTHAQALSKPDAWELVRDEIDSATHGELDAFQLDKLTDWTIEAANAR